MQRHCLTSVNLPVRRLQIIPNHYSRNDKAQNPRNNRSNAETQTRNPNHITKANDETT